MGLEKVIMRPRHPIENRVQDSEERDAIVVGRAMDGKPYIEVKDAIIARSGIYMYRREEVLARGFKPKVEKDWYREFRPASVIVAAKELFNLVPVPPREHTPDLITAENFHALASGVVGGPIDVVALEGTEDIALKGKIAFYTKDSYDYYMAGNKETSADYESETVLVDNPEKVGYDIIMTKIRSVNNVAIVAHGRGGKSVRVQDSLPEENIIDKITGRTSMGVISSLLGIGKANGTFSAQVKEAITRVKDSSDKAVIETELNRVMDSVNPFTESANKQALIGAVRDSFSHPAEVLAGWKETAPLIDGLFARCTDSEAAILASIKDSKDDKGGKDGKDKEPDNDEDDKKKGRVKDSIDAAVAQVKDSAEKHTDAKIAELEGRLPGLIADGIKAALGAGSKPDVDRVQDSLPDEDIDTSFIFEPRA